VEILLIPNFTLAGDARKGRRPSFDLAMKPERAGPMFDKFISLLRQTASPVPIEAGVFRAEMRVSLTNEGPVTIILDSADAPP
jgi:D-tyrosyl-tRNA(Tyr) deacylase